MNSFTCSICPYQAYIICRGLSHFDTAGRASAASAAHLQVLEKTGRLGFSFVGQVIYGPGGTKPVLYASSVHTARAKNTCQVDEGRMQYRARVHLSWEGVFNCEGQPRD